MNTITAKQQAQFLIWIEKNQTSMTMLNNLWNLQHSHDAGDDDATNSSDGMGDDSRGEHDEGDEGDDDEDDEDDEEGDDDEEGNDGDDDEEAA